MSEYRELCEQINRRALCNGLLLGTAMWSIIFGLLFALWWWLS